MINAIIRVLCIAIITIIAGCEYVGDIEESQYYYEKKTQERFLEELQKRDISHRIDDNKHIWYKVSDRKVVASIVHDIIHERHPGNSVVVEEDYYKSMLIRKLENNNINYTVRPLTRGVRILWNKKDADSVHVIINEVSEDYANIMLDRMNKSGQSK